MRKFLMIAAVSGSTLLGGCATTGSGGISVTAVQQAALTVCAFLPTVATVANIIAASNPLLTTAESIAEAICSAVTAKAYRRGDLPTVSGVVIHGRFVR